MKLYYFPVAPNPTKVRLYLAEKHEAGAALDVEQVLVDYRKGEQNEAEHRARNPFGRTPVLELDDGSYVRESLPIIEYFEELCPEPPMIGSTPAERARVRELERIADLEVLLPVARIVHATRSPLGLPPSPEVAAYNRTRLDRSLPELERVLADGRPFLAGDRPTIADGTLLAGLNFGLAFSVEPDPELRHLARWQERCRARPAAKVLARAR